MACLAAIGTGCSSQKATGSAPATAGALAGTGATALPSAAAPQGDPPAPTSLRVASSADALRDAAAPADPSTVEIPRDVHLVFASSPLVGRLALELGDEVVPVDHPFHEGDRLRFVVSSSETGWLFIYHADDGHKMALLWPPSGEATAENFVTKGAELRVPSGATIEFDRDTGDERFSVILVEKPVVEPREQRLSPGAGQTTPPQVVRPAPATRSAPSSDPDEVVQIRVRGGLEVRLRGVRLKPDPSQPFVEFTAIKGDDGTVASVNFRLKHVH